MADSWHPAHDLTTVITRPAGGAPVKRAVAQGCRQQQGQPPYRQGQRRKGKVGRVEAGGEQHAGQGHQRDRPRGEPGDQIDAPVAAGRAAGAPQGKEGDDKRNIGKHDADGQFAKGDIEGHDVAPSAA